jgi:Protein of unknown function (DUF3455)
MQIIKQLTFGSILVLSAAVFAIADDRAPELPSGCERLEVDAGNNVSFHTYAIGVQRHRWNGIAWVFVEPVAKLFANEDYMGETGIHYVGPTWESNSGSKVVAVREEGCNVDPTAIDWLLLRAVSNEGPGPFKKVTYIQRVNTVGGRAPAAPGSSVGALIDVPYTAEYYFYKGASDGQEHSLSGLAFARFEVSF